MILIILNTMLGIATSALLLALLRSSYKEKEWRAVAISVLIFSGNVILWCGLTIFQEIPAVTLLNIIFIILILLLTLLSVIKWFPTKQKYSPEFIPQFDERDHMFARNNLQYHPKLAERYYQRYPARRKTDEAIHILPELLSPGSRFYDELISPVAMAADSVTVATREASKIEKSEQPVMVDPEKITQILQQLGRFHGAAEIGITRLHPYHLYSHAGRRAENWGEAITTDHTYAIAIMIPMTIEMIMKAPLLPEILESTGKYVESAKIAHIIANYIKYLGYDAKAHFDGHYQVACVPLARDAGLGEVGRLSILINPTHGPCVRLAVVTTDLELKVTTSTNHYIEDFCDICKKCAENCPSKSIPFQGKPAERGFLHWSIDMESCYAFWSRIGTDCGICIRVCPFTKPNTLIHKLARFYISRNAFNQRIALLLDNLLYGRKIPMPTLNPEKTKMLP